VEESKLLFEETEENINQEMIGGEQEMDGGRGRKSTLMKYSKEVFISRVEIIDHRKIKDHVSYVIRVRGRTKYLVSAKDLAEIGLISKDTYERDQKMEEIRRSTSVSRKGTFLDQVLSPSLQN
jgi:hypothetical protein